MCYCISTVIHLGGDRIDWTLDKSRSICRQIYEKICVAIVSGEFRSGDKIYSVREVALAAKITPNTVQKSYEELERASILRSVPYSGWYVNNNTDAAKEEVERLCFQNAEDYLAAMACLGVGKTAARDYLIKHLQEGKE